MHTVSYDAQEVSPFLLMLSKFIYRWKRTSGNEKLRRTEAVIGPTSRGLPSTVRLHRGLTRLNRNGQDSGLLPKASKLDRIRSGKLSAGGGNIGAK